MEIADYKILSRRVDEVLFYVWDPIGVAGDPRARCEYESYVPKVCQIVDNNDEVEPISSYLAEIAGSEMGLSPDKKQYDHTAEILLRYKHAIKEAVAKYNNRSKHY